MFYNKNNRTNFKDYTSSSDDEYSGSDEYTTTVNRQTNQVVAMKETPKLYLLSPETSTGLKGLSSEQFIQQKNFALNNLQINLDGVNSFIDVCNIFREVTNAKQGMLRYRREHLFGGYKDTNSYKEAINKIYTAATSKLQPQTYAEYNQFFAILLEQARLGFNINDKLEETKELSCDALKKEIYNEKSLDKLMPYINFILDPKSILRRHRDIFRHDYGDTKSYKSALKTISEKISDLPKRCSPEELPNLNRLYAELIRCQPTLNQQWDELTVKLKTFIDTAEIGQNSSKEYQAELKH